ncbi:MULTISPECIES: replication initiation protein [Burkholderia]|uniref:Initiator Replication family protein n=2 Tax=Burkholderia gladioli TaxID=28095 RepID=A0AAW3EUL1_BURGA|nr:MULTISPECIES: replication initiation protein [Burkholderia]AEA65601.1 initiator RepB protein [Burkholderia gladioli BSR3]KGC10560.1 initiator Replication family protein [Burkholderia gladioli]KKJ06031.1 replication protein RepB [Burkholderia gladioli]MCA8171436.1 replication initiation protein [Burkholderia gladioli]MDN7466023.1 replication initiation protein [Burkholderia gladioli]
MAKKQPADPAVSIVDLEPIMMAELDEPALDGDGKVKGTVAMSRALVNSQQGLTLNEKRVMMAALRSVDSKKSPYLHGQRNGYVCVRVRVDEFAALAALAPRSGEKQATAAYEGLRDGCNSLQKRTLTYMDGPRKVTLNWVWKAVYHEGEGWAEISFSPDLTPHIFMLQRRFVSYQLEFARGLQSIYSWRLLELLMRERDRGRLLITLDDFRKTLEIPDTYRFADIKRRVIDMALSELNKKADLVIECRAVKVGRAVNSLDFTFVQNPQRSLELDVAA